MKETKITFISSGFKEILMSEGIKDILDTEATKIQANANSNNSRGGEGFSKETWVGGYGGGRWVSSVSTTDIESQIAESEDKALSRAVK